MFESWKSDLERSLAEIITSNGNQQKEKAIDVVLESIVRDFADPNHVNLWLMVNDILDEPEKLVQDYSLTDGLIALILDAVGGWQLKYKSFCLDD